MFSRSDRKSIQHHMGKDKDLVNESPGPGDYTLPKLIGDMPTYSLPKIKNKGERQSALAAGIGTIDLD